MYYISLQYWLNFIWSQVITFGLLPFFHYNKIGSLISWVELTATFIQYNYVSYLNIKTYLVTIIIISLYYI